MLREKMIKNKRTRIGRILPAAAAAVFAVCGLGSCAALEMLDSLAAEEENTVQTPPAAKPEASQQASVSVPESGQDNPAPDETKPAEDSSSAQDSSTAPAVTTSPVESVIGQIESVIASPQPADSTAPAGTPDVSAVDLPEVTIGGGSSNPMNTSSAGDSSTGALLTDIAESGVNPNESTADIYTPGGYTPDATAETSAQSAAPQTGSGLPVYLAYTELVDKYAAYTARDPEYKPEYCHYYITDIDNSGVPELLIETGTIETDRTIYVYTFDGGSAELLGNFVAWHTRLGDGDGVIYTETSAMGSYIVSTITIKEGKLFTERGEQPFSESQLKMPLISYSLTDPSALDALK